MTEETPNHATNQRVMHKARPYMPLTLGTVTFLSTLGFTGNWWRIATHNFRGLDTARNSQPALRETYTPESISAHSANARRDFKTFMLTTLRQYGNDMNESEIKLAESILDRYELLEEYNGASGFYGAAWRNIDTNEIVISFGGADARIFKTPGEFIRDLDDIIMSPTGSPISQLDDAVAFTQSVTRKFGKATHITGHSLGGYLALYVTGMGLCDEAKCTTFDATGYSDNMIATCAERSGRSETEIRKRFESPDIYTSVTVIHNGYNCMGKQAGLHLTFSNDVNCRPFVPEKHFYHDFRNAFASGAPLIAAQPAGMSYESTVSTLALLTLSTAALAFGIRGTRRRLQAKKDDTANHNSYGIGR